jgi:hypothetical protein
MKWALHKATWGKKYAKTASFLIWTVGTLLISLLAAASARAQFTASIQGTVSDPSAAGVAQAKVTVENLNTHITAETTTDGEGGYRFLSLAPGPYKLSVEAKGFSKAESNFTLETNQILNLPISLKVGATTESVVVTGENPILNTAETRNQQTIESQELSTETALDLSANGQGTVANMWVVDSLDITSNIRQGVLNLVPNPDVVQETTIQVNTFSSEYGRGSGLQTTMTTKSGSDEFHGMGGDYFNRQGMYAKYSLPGSDHPYAPFHGNNFVGTIGGPIIPHHEFFFFFGIQALRSSTSTGNQVLTFADPAFASWAQTNYSGTFGTKLLTTYVPTHIAGTTVIKTANDIFPGTCGTAATNDLPCSTAMLDSGTFNGTNYRNGTQYFVRVDKYFKNDRIYGSFFRTLLGYGGSAPIPQFTSSNNTWERAFQVNWTHTFSPTLLNEAVFAQNRIEGKLNETGDFTVPTVNVTGQNLGYGLGFAQGDFIQHNYHWRDVLTNVRGAHVIKVGYDGWFGDDVELFQGPWSHPSFNFDNLLALAQDAPSNESGVMYNPITGQQQLWDWNAASKTWGIFAEDTWKARRNLTLTLGFRFDDQGNPYSRSASTVFGNFYLGSGSTFQDRVASGFAKPTHNALKSTPRSYTPRIAAAWDINGSGNWVLRGGFGMYSNWLTPANIQEEFRGNPPGLILPTFSSANADPATRPIFVQGTSSKPPFGFQFPALAGTTLCPTAPCLDANGGIPGAGLTIGGIDPNIASPTAYIFAATLEHRLGSHFVASILYSGSHTVDLVGNGNLGGVVSYGVDVNSVPGDLIGTPPNTLPARLNPSFGAINYTQNDRVGNYNGVTFDLRARVSRGFFDASYTRSSSKDDASQFPTAIDPHQYYGPSPWDTPNRFSLSFNYELPGLNGGQGFVGHITGGWGLSGTSIYQTGYPFTVFTRANFWNGGDYNADGDNYDFPDVSTYHQGTSRGAYTTTGVFGSGQFSAPTSGTEGNEKFNQFRNPAFVQTDMTIYKNTHITERLNFQFRFEFYNFFNHPNFQSIQGDLSAGNFGFVTSQTLPRWWQIGGKLTF